MAVAAKPRGGTRVALPDDLVEEIDAIVGPRRRAEFVREAVAEMVRRKRMIAAIDDMTGSLADVDIPGWETPEASAEWVRSLREEWDERDENAANQREVHGLR